MQRNLQCKLEVLAAKELEINSFIAGAGAPSDTKGRKK